MTVKLLTVISTRSTPVLRSLHCLPASSPAYYVQGRHHSPQMSKRPCSSVGYLSSDLQYTGQRRTGMRSASAALLKCRGRELQSATGRSASLDHESGTLYLLLFVT